MCDTGFGGYVDLATQPSIPIYPLSTIFGDTKAWTAFSGQDPFVFFGKTYSGFGFTDDGFLMFDTFSNYPDAPSPYLNQLMPDPVLPNNVAAVLWKDMRVVYEAETKGVSIATAGTGISIVEYDDIQDYNHPTQTYDFEAVVYSGLDDRPGYYEMVFAYDNINGGLTNVTIGVENALGTEAFTFVNQDDATAEIQNGTMICFDYVVPSEPHVITYQLEVTTTSPGVITNTVSNTVTNPGAVEVLVSNEIWVTSSLFLPIIIK